MVTQSQMPVALLGAATCADSYAEAISCRAQLRTSLDEPGVAAAVVAPSAHDPFSHAREALLAGIPVLYAAPFHLSPWQASVLDELSRRKGRILRFIEAFQYQTGYAFLQRLLEGREPFWRPLYVRSLSSTTPQAQASIDELATEELALYDSLLDAKPRRVTAFAVGRDEAAQVCAASFTVEYESGPSLHSIVSLAEASAAHQFVAVASERTVVFDQMDEQVPLSITGVDAAGQDVSFGENHGSNSGDIFAHELGRYLTAVDESDISYGNATRWTRVAATWWAGRQSMSVGGAVQVPALEQTKRPPSLTVIEGGGYSSSPVAGRPALTVVA